MNVKTLLVVLFAIMIIMSAMFVLHAKQPPAVLPLPVLLKVFPGAVGFGTESVAGRGGAIIKVTNLNDQGPGSLRNALKQEGPRIVVFEVGGMISLADRIIVDNPYVTIAGQTAPSPGITLKGAGITIRTHDVLLQHLRIRVGDSPQGPDPMIRDGMEILGPESFNVVVDHVSASWAIDENGSTWYPLSGVTINQCIFSEGLKNSLHPKGPHSMGLLIGDHSHDIFIRGNLFAHNSERNPRINGDTSVVLVNNLAYNVQSSSFVLIGSIKGSSHVSAAGNVFLKGPNTRSRVVAIKVDEDATKGTAIYLKDNIPSFSEFDYEGQFDPRVQAPPIWVSPLEVMRSEFVEDWVLANAGARPLDRDDVDKRVVAEVKNRSGKVIDKPEDSGGWLSFEQSKRPFVVPMRPHDDDDGDGYSNIEEVLHELSRQLEPPIRVSL